MITRQSVSFSILIKWFYTVGRIISGGWGEYIIISYLWINIIHLCNGNNASIVRGGHNQFIRCINLSTFLKASTRLAGGDTSGLLRSVSETLCGSRIKCDWRTYLVARAGLQAGSRVERGGGGQVEGEGRGGGRGGSQEEEYKNSGHVNFSEAVRRLGEEQSCVSCQPVS